MKKLLLFTFLGPLIGSTLMYSLICYGLGLTIKNDGIKGFFLLWIPYVVFGYMYGIVPAFVTGLFSYFLDLQKWLHVLVCIVFGVSFTAIGLYLINSDADFLWAIVPSFAATLLISLFIKWKGY